MLRNQWYLGIYLNMTLLKVEQGHFETAIWILHNFCSNSDLNLTPVTGTTNGFIFQIINLLIESWGYAWPVLTVNIFMIQRLCTVMQLFKGFSVDAASRHFWPNSAIANGASYILHLVPKHPTHSTFNFIGSCNKHPNIQSQNATKIHTLTPLTYELFWKK